MAAEDIYDLIFSYDYFLEQNETAASFAKRLITELRKHSDAMDIFKVIPVVHIRTMDGKHTLSNEEATQIFSQVVSEIECPFVAIPERELGPGIISRAHLTKMLAQVVRSKTKGRCNLHILGCGNLLSFSILSVAGAVMCDGLEWCRTFAAEHFHLHHFQQKEMFPDPNYHAGDPVYEFMHDSGTA